MLVRGVHHTHLRILASPIPYRHPIITVHPTTPPYPVVLFFLPPTSPLPLPSHYLSINSRSRSMSATATSTALSSADKPPRRFPPPCWTQDEALALIKAYRDRWYALRRGYLRTADWDAVADHVGRLCPGAIPPKTSAQCRHKMEKLRQRYRAEKQRALSFPAGHFLSTWFYFNAMDSMEKNANANGNGSNPDDDLNPVGMQIVNSKINHQSNTIIDPIYGALNPGRGIRFKPVAPDNNLVTIASRAHNVRVSQNSQEEDNDDEFDDVYYSQTLIGNNNSGKNHRLSSQNYAGARPRKFSRIGSNPNNNNNNNSYWNENGEEEDDDDDNENGEDDVWVKMRKERNDRKSGRDYNDSIGQIVSSIKVLADGFVKMEKMKMDMVHEIEKMRMEAEMKRNKLLLESQKQIVEAFVKGLSENKRQHQ